MSYSKPVVIDTDPGLDDALALVLALRAPSLDVRAITVVSGNVPLPASTANVLRILETLEFEAPPHVFEGCAKPLSSRVARAEHVHGTDGLGGLSQSYPVVRLRPTGGHAADAIVELARQRRGTLTLIALGPLTNVAAAIQRDAEAMAGIREIVVMGGSLDGRGNATPNAEFNFYSDPTAARIVVRAGLPVTLVGLNVTEQALLPQSRFHRRLETMQPIRLRRFVADVGGRYFDFCAKRRGSDTCVLHDPLAVATAIRPELVDTERIACDVVDRPGLTRGLMTVDRGGVAPNMCPVRVATAVQEDRFLDFFLDTLCGS